MNRRACSIFIAILFIVPSFCCAQTRSTALKQPLEQFWKEWEKLPKEYRDLKQTHVEQYLRLFETSNGFTWNREWARFSRFMGPEFEPLHSYVIEAMKYAEAFESLYPKPDEKLEKIAGTLLGAVPTNALLFVHNDLFETLLLIHQQRGVRKDVLLVNSSRLFYPSYIQILFDRYPGEFRGKPSEIVDRVVKEALKKRNNGDMEYEELRVIGNKQIAENWQVIDALSFLMMQDIHRSIPNRTVLFLPSMPKPEHPRSWRHLYNVGLFFTWDKFEPKEIHRPLDEWKSFLDIAAPAGTPLHADMVKALDQTIQAAITIFRDQEAKVLPDRLQKLWSQSSNRVTTVSSQDIIIDIKGDMKLRKGSLEK